MRYSPATRDTVEDCIMCGIRVKEKTKVSIGLRPGEVLPFCCPHCVIMQMALPRPRIEVPISVIVGNP